MCGGRERARPAGLCVKTTLAGVTHRKLQLPFPGLGFPPSFPPRRLQRGLLALPICPAVTHPAAGGGAEGERAIAASLQAAKTQRRLPDPRAGRTAGGPRRQQQQRQPPLTRSLPPTCFPLASRPSSPQPSHSAAGAPGRSYLSRPQKKKKKIRGRGGGWGARAAAAGAQRGCCVESRLPFLSTGRREALGPGPTLGLRGFLGARCQ